MSFSRLLFLLVLALCIGLFLRAFVVEPVYVASESMEPTLKKDDHLWLDKATYRFRAPARGELIAFRSPAGEKHDSIKRVIAVGGDTVEIKDKKVYVNGSYVNENYTQHKRAGEKLAGDNLEKLEVPESHFFVLGDNRDLSYDSATWKDARTGDRIFFIPQSSISGKIRGIY
jgi:signal peptidase I